VKTATKQTVVGVVLLFVSLWVITSVEITTVSLRTEIIALGVVMLSATIVASLLVLYFDWRARLLSRVRGGQV
jgi:hypothetical protein